MEQGYIPTVSKGQQLGYFNLNSRAFPLINFWQGQSNCGLKM